MNEKMFNIGKIINTHGVRGEVKVLRISDFEERFAVGETVYAVKESEEEIELVIGSHRIHKGFDLLIFEGYDNINDVEHLKGSQLKITEGQLTALDEGEFYYHEIIGCEVFTNNEEHLGIIKEILSPGANDIWVVKQAQGNDLLIPYIEDVVKEIDIEAQRILIEPMEGLLD
ncbi:16S rRNA processing protein RimM [Virgibacillus natechei]|uniref:Ribosome maturation factor RimM n=1 Tax=Virgibacillus natechei TaxID=1216297 RepID=A0ABS4IDM5_9BACI|nr:ribosome maturation factor RimM [Virgibacillus natechei]MBP1968124.1 16S rRNA processing protein RimM [Virgibacillus natechei]UZD14597.1 ribosome maturation factor RimM [Virgibacillus natechei]